MYGAERGVFELRRGRPVQVTAGASDEDRQSALVAAVEGLDDAALARMKLLAGSELRLVLTSHRAGSMGLGNGATGNRNGNGKGLVRAVSLPLPGGCGPDDVLRLSSAVGAHAFDPTDVAGASPAEVGGLTLARLGRLIPAVVSAPARMPGPELRDALDSGVVLSVPTEEIVALAGAPRLEVTHVSGAPVPLEEAENARFMLFREGDGFLEHVAILIGEPSSWPDPVPVRLHSACLTGDLFGSLRCDCGEQLRGSLRVFAARGGGVLLYLAQEGRGIGLGNKLRAYALQQEGLDTVDADCVLGFGADERHYDAAVEMLRHLQIDRVELLTNNPEKVHALEEGGVTVVDRRPLHGTLNRHNLPYVEAKVRRAGHWLHDMLAGAGPKS